MKAVIEHLTDLIAIPSVSCLSNVPIINYAAEILGQYGWSTKRLTYRDANGIEKANLVAAPRGEDPDYVAVDLAIMCHTDTVPYSADWTGAVNPVASDGMIYGCGACDVKGFLACLLTIVSGSDSSSFRRGLRVILTADEEVGCVGASSFLARSRIRPTRVVIGEPTSLRPARAGKGYCLGEVTVFGREAHSAYPRQGRSAIYLAARLITMIEGYAEQLREQRDEFFTPAYTTLNIGTIHGGSAKNVVPGECAFQLEWRALPGSSANKVLEAVKTCAKTLEAAEPAIHIQIKVSRQQEGFETPATAALVQAIERATGRSATSIPFGSEASLLASVAEEVVVFGPGDMRTAHSSRECVSISELEQAVGVLRSLMRKS